MTYLRTVHVPPSGERDDHTFVLLHGIGLSHHEFSGLARLLSTVGRVVSFDLAGYGSTPRPNHQMSMEDHATRIGAKLRQLGTRPAIVVGHSMGAQFAIELARQSPELVERVVLVGPVVDSSRRTLTAQAIALARDSALEPVPTQLMVLGDYLRCGPRWFLAQAIVMRDYPTEEAITSVPHPLLIIRGENDRIANAEWCEFLARQAPNGMVDTIPSRRHDVVHSDPAATAASILGFLDSPV